MEKLFSSSPLSYKDWKVVILGALQAKIDLKQAKPVGEPILISWQKLDSGTRIFFRAHFSQFVNATDQAKLAGKIPATAAQLSDVLKHGKLGKRAAVDEVDESGISPRVKRTGAKATGAKTAGSKTAGRKRSHSPKATMDASDDDDDDDDDDEEE